MIDWRGWAKRKREAQEGEAVARWRRALAAVPPGGDLTPFLAPDVPEVVRQEALQRLWTTGAFGQPDELDSDFIDVTTDPVLNEDEVRGLVQWQNITSCLQREEQQDQVAGEEPGTSPDGVMVSVSLGTDAQKLNSVGAHAACAQTIETEKENARLVSSYIFVKTKAS